MTIEKMPSDNPKWIELFASGKAIGKLVAVVVFVIAAAAGGHDISSKLDELSGSATQQSYDVRRSVEALVDQVDDLESSVGRRMDVLSDRLRRIEAWRSSVDGHREAMEVWKSLIEEYSGVRRKK